MAASVQSRYFLHPFLIPEIAKIITELVGSTTWTTNLSALSVLEDYAEDESIQSRWQEAHSKSKHRLAEFIERTQGVSIPEHFLFDVMVKRIHEYKRQLLDILYVIYRYQWIKGLSESERKAVVPRVVFFGGKVSPFVFGLQAGRSFLPPCQERHQTNQ